MSDINITIPGGSSKRLLTFGKYCDADIVVTAEGGGGAPEGDFPGGYKRVSSIRFTGAQAVETGIKCNQNTKIRAVFTRDTADIMYLYGYISAGNTASMTAYMSDAGGYWRFGNQRSSYVMPVNESLIQTAIVTKKGITRANLNASYGTVSAFECGNTLLLGAAKYIDGSIDPALFVGRSLLFEMWDGDTKVLEFVPVVSLEGVYGFFDTIKEEFHTSITDTPLLLGDL